MKAIMLIVSLYDTDEHPQRVMQRIGVTYKKAVPQSMADCWQFYMCEYDAKKLPDFVRIRNDIDPQERVGYGLSQGDADEISSWMKQNGFEIK